MSYNEQDIAQALLQLIEKTKSKENLTEDQKKKAAYALNLCTVSVSQIIDYDDITVLEQEYEAVLNNLNLQQMPKDQALLNILNHLLDTITFFRIQEGDKKFIDRRYQHHIKNAIWESIPGLSIFTTLNPLNIATTVGLSYMNYRKRKASYILERDYDKWNLERAAIDQLNSLQRELFDTSWRLADTYHFDDKFRLTERQIKQYNEILKDPNPARRYERLASIKDNFCAYPPFWYFLGHAAMEVMADTDSLDKNQRNRLISKAQEAFDQLLDNRLYNILREDPVISACALEYIDTLDAQRDKEKISRLLEKALEMSGNAFDIWELCALAYLKIDDFKKACELLRRLVNEDYNTEVNVQLLSSLYMKIYVCTANENDSAYALEHYRLLARRTTDYYLFPIPKERTAMGYEESQQDFINLKKHDIKRRYGMVLLKYIAISQLQFENLYKNYFHNQFPDPRDIISFFNGILKSVYQLPGVSIPVQKDVLKLISIALEAHRKQFIWDQKERKTAQIDPNLFNTILYPAFNQIGNSISAYIDMAQSLSELSEMENGLSEFCQSTEIEEPELIRHKEAESMDLKLLDITVFGKLSEKCKAEAKQYAQVEAVLKAYPKIILKQNTCKNTKLLMNNDENRHYFEKYFSNWIFSSGENRTLKRNAVAILVDEKHHNDIIITPNGIRRRIGFANTITRNVRFGEIDWGKKGRDELLLGNLESSINFPYRNDEVKIDILLEMFRKLNNLTEDVYTEMDKINPVPMLIKMC